MNIEPEHVRAEGDGAFSLGSWACSCCSEAGRVTPSLLLLLMLACGWCTSACTSACSAACSAVCSAVLCAGDDAVGIFCFGFERWCRRVNLPLIILHALLNFVQAGRASLSTGSVDDDDDGDRRVGDSVLRSQGR